MGKKYIISFPAPSHHRGKGLVTLELCLMTITHKCTSYIANIHIHTLHNFLTASYMTPDALTVMLTLTSVL